MSIHALSQQTLAYMNIAAEGRRLQKIAVLLDTALATSTLPHSQPADPKSIQTITATPNGKGSLLDIKA